MSVGGLPRCVALMVVLAWMLWPYAPRGRALLPVSSRVPRAGRKTGAGDAVRNGRVMGLSGVIAHMSSSVRAGGMISDVLADVDGSGFAGVPLTASRLKRLLMRQRMPGESAAQPNMSPSNSPWPVRCASGQDAPLPIVWMWSARTIGFPGCCMIPDAVLSRFRARRRRCWARCRWSP